MIYSNSFNMDTPTINNDTNKEDAIFNLREQNKKLYDKIKEMKKVNRIRKAIKNRFQFYAGAGFYF